MKNNILKISIIISIFLILNICFIPTAYSLNDPDKYKPNSLEASDTEALLGKGNVIIGVIQVIGSLISVATLIMIGIKYMVGSVEEKAEYKKTMFPYIVGAVMLFAAANIVQVIYDWASALN